MIECDNGDTTCVVDEVRADYGTFMVKVAENIVRIVAGEFKEMSAEYETEGRMWSKQV
jgi:hypothetical protein